MHNRFDREVLAFKKDFMGALAKWLVKQSPYVVPDNLSICIEKFYEGLDSVFDFSNHGMAKIELSSLTKKVNKMLEEIPEIVALNECKSGKGGHIFTSRFHDGHTNPDEDFIDIMAVAQNITCEFADREDAQCWLDKER